MDRHFTGLVCGRRSKYAVLVIWVVALIVLGPLAGKLSGAQDNQTSSWLPASAESTKAYDQLGTFVDRNSIPAIVVYHRDGGLTAADRAKATADVATYRKQIPHLGGPIVGPIPSSDGTTLQTLVPLHVDPKSGWNDLPTTARAIKATAVDGAHGMSVHLGGPVGFGADQADAFAGIDGTLLFGTLGVVILILLLTYRSPVLWVLPILSAGVALIAAQAFIYVLVDNTGLTVNGQSYGILTVLVIGAGTDYALLLVARYREELRRHEDRHEAMAFALHRSGPAIIASGGTVILGMLCLLAAEMNSTKGLGPVAALGIVFALLAMLTLLPALLVTMGRWVFWPRRPTYASPEPTQSGWWARVGGFIRPRPRAVWLVTVGILLLCALGLTQLNSHSLSTTQSFTGNPDSVTASKLLQGHYKDNSSDPAYVLVDTATAGTTATRLSSAGFTPAAKPITRGDRSLLQTPVSGDPYSSKAFDQIKRIRRIAHDIPGSHTLVGGTTAVTYDVQQATGHDSRTIIPLTLFVVLIILGVLLRAIVAPVLLILTVIVSFGAALGLSSLVFHYVFGFAGTDPSLPLFVFVFLVALGIDYNIFLMTRVREEARQHGTRRGAIVGLSATGGVITSAGLVLASTFAVLGTLPLVAFAEIGFAVALGVLLDTIVVRAVLVTALTLDLGPRIWWPGKLRLVPDASAEKISSDAAQEAATRV